MEKENIAEIDRIQDIVKVFVETADPQKVYLFGSFATGKNRPDSDYDFYIVVDDDVPNLCELHGKAEAAVGAKRVRPLDILMVTEKYFEEKLKDQWPIEKEVYDEGVLLYERAV